MADPPTAAKTKVAVTRKHLRRDQAAARKARSTALPGSDTVKERQVVSPYCTHRPYTKSDTAYRLFLLLSHKLY